MLTDNSVFDFGVKWPTLLEIDVEFVKMRRQFNVEPQSGFIYHQTDDATLEVSGLGGVCRLFADFGDWQPFGGFGFGRYLGALTVESKTPIWYLPDGYVDISSREIYTTFMLGGFQYSIHPRLSTGLEIRRVSLGTFAADRGTRLAAHYPGRVPMDGYLAIISIALKVTTLGP